MKNLFAIALAVVFASPVIAQPMNGAEFEAYTTGKTLYYGQDGAAYGAEVYMENRRVRWSFLDGDCKEGYWYEADREICFVYEDRLDAQCWTFQRRAGGLIATFVGDSGGSELYEAQDANAEMLCLGPQVGV